MIVLRRTQVVATAGIVALAGVFLAACLPSGIYADTEDFPVGEEGTVTGVLNYYEPVNPDIEPEGYIVTGDQGRLYLSPTEPVPEADLEAYSGKEVEVTGVFDRMPSPTAPEPVTTEKGAVPPPRKEFPAIRPNRVRVHTTD
ncbi:MAG: hypothetical protein ACOC8D_00745 [bacterium]